MALWSISKETPLPIAISLRVSQQPETCYVGYGVDACGDFARCSLNSARAVAASRFNRFIEVTAAANDSGGAQLCLRPWRLRQRPMA